MDDRRQIIELGKRFFVIVVIYTLIILAVIGYWLYKETRPATAEFEILYLDKADINMLTGYSNIDCFAERYDMAKQKSIYTCIGTKIKN